MSEKKYRPCETLEELLPFWGIPIRSKTTGCIRSINGFDLPNKVKLSGIECTLMRVFEDFETLDSPPRQVGVEVEERWRPCTAADIANGPVEGRVRDGADDDWLPRTIIGYVWDSSFSFKSKADSWIFAEVRE